jgi:hypothetical protein
MAKWEYRLVYIAPNKEGRLIIADTIQQEGPSIGTNANDYLQYLGQQEWEVASSFPLPVSVSTDVGWRQVSSNLAILFKRQVP